jgi:hypothetical protein
MAANGTNREQQRKAAREKQKQVFINSQIRRGKVYMYVGHRRPFS